jgi:mono/diheme cytochrome c family protein
MKGRALRVLQLSDDGASIDSERIYFQKRFGRLRDLCVTPGGDVYLATSNTDWHPRFQPWMYDSLPEGEDRILRLRKVDGDEAARLVAMENAVEIVEDPEPLPLLSEDWSFPATDEELVEGQRLYMIHCATCHSPEGRGVADLLPPLAGTDWVTGDKSRLIQTVLFGLSGPVTVNGAVYDQEMPAAAHLTDDEIAAILTFIRKSFGNDANAVIPGEVYAEREMSR